MIGRHTLLALGLACMGLIVVPHHAQAQVVVDYGPGYGVAYGPGYWVEPVPYYVAGPPMMTLGHEFYDVSVGGLGRLCNAHPQLCNTQQIQSDLRALRKKRIAGHVLAWSGFAAAVAGPIISTAINCSDDTPFCGPSGTVVLASVVGGVAVGITGLAILPGPHEVVRTVNAINQAHPDSPVNVSFGLMSMPSGHDGQSLAMVPSMTVKKAF